MTINTRRTRISLLLLFIVFTVATVSAADDSTEAGAAQLQEAPAGASSPAASTEHEGSISDPAGGSDAKSILAGSSHMMGGSDDSTDGDHDDAKSLNGEKRQEDGGHHGQCVTACATKSTEGVGCGKDLSKPDCFCKSEDFVQQTFACINATCPQQFHGAAGVVTSICAVAGAPNLTIPGYQGSDNLEHMPTINDDDGKQNSTNSTNTTTSIPPSGIQNVGTTSTFTMPAGMQTPNSGSTPPKSGSTTPEGGASSGAVGREAVGMVAAVTAAALVASVGVWTLF